MNLRILTLLLPCLLLASCVNAFADDEFGPKFYAFSNGVPAVSIEEEATLLKELGFDGISQLHASDGGWKLAERVAAYEKKGLKVLSIYLSAGEKPIEAEMVRALENRGCMIELTVAKITPEVVESLRQTAEMAAAMKIRVALYPHFGLAVATLPQAMDLADRVNHPNVGIMFNLCHFLMSEKAEGLENALTKAGPRLFSVSTCGADLGGQDWSQLIQPLDRGTFPQQRLFASLKTLGYKGPVTLQGYKIPGDRRENLKRSIAAWKKLLAEIP